MHFEIRSALQPGKQITKQQRASGFSEAPLLAGKILRRGVVVRMTPDQIDVGSNSLNLLRLLESESVIIEAVDGDLRSQVRLVNGKPEWSKAIEDPPVPEGTDEVRDAGAGGNIAPVAGGPAEEASVITEVPQKPEEPHGAAPASVPQIDVSLTSAPTPESKEKKGKKDKKDKI